MPQVRAPDVRIALVLLASMFLANCAPGQEGEAPPETFATASAATSSDETQDCADITPNSAYTECFRQRALAALDDVAAELPKARTLAEAADAEYSRYAPDSTNADDKMPLARHLAMSHQNWTRYVEGQCELESTAAHGGSGTDTLRQKCRLRLARLRLEELRSAEALIDGNR